MLKRHRIKVFSKFLKPRIKDLLDMFYSYQESNPSAKLALRTVGLSLENNLSGKWAALIFERGLVHFSSFRDLKNLFVFYNIRKKKNCNKFILLLRDSGQIKFTNSNKNYELVKMKQCFYNCNRLTPVSFII